MTVYNAAMKKSIITIAGALGSGKSSTAKGVAELLGFRHTSSGDLFRKIAKERGLSVEALNLTAEQQKDIDYQVDEWLTTMGREESNFVIDSRLAFHWMPDSFKVYLSLDPESAAERIFLHMKDAGRVSEDATTIAEVRASIDRRYQSEQKRYKDLYNVDPSDPKNFDLVIDTKQNDLKTVIHLVVTAYQNWFQN